MKATITLRGQQHDVVIRFGNYANNNRLAVFIDSAEGGPFGRVSVNLDDNIPIADDEFAVKQWGENEGITEQLAHLFEDTGRVVPAGLAKAPIWKLKHDPRQSD